MIGETVSVLSRRSMTDLPSLLVKHGEEYTHHGCRIFASKVWLLNNPRRRGLLGIHVVSFIPVVEGGHWGEHSWHAWFVGAPPPEVEGSCHVEWNMNTDIVRWWVSELSLERLRSLGGKYCLPAWPSKPYSEKLEIEL